MISTSQSSAAASTPAIMPDEITVSLEAGPPPGPTFRSGNWPVIYDGSEYWINAEVSTAIPYNDQIRMVAEAAARQIRVAKEVIREPPGPPVISSLLTAPATVGTTFTYRITASNRPTSYGATGLPTGLSVNTSTGYITGIPAAAGSYPIQISATNATGTDTQTLTLTVSTPLPVVSPGAITGTPGTAITTFQINATHPPILSYAITPALPTGLTLNTATGQITGTPGAASSGTFSITATNAGGTSAPANLTVTITALPIPVVSAGAITGVPGTAITTFQIAATHPPILSYAVTPALPTGLTLNTTNGQITGTPAAVSSGTFSITATNAGGTSAPANLSIIISAIPVPAITSALTYRVAPGGTVSYQMAASNGPITAYAATGLPAGVTVNTTTGLISGTAPATLGDTNVTLTATNAGGTSAPATLVFTVAAGWEISNQTPGNVTVISTSATKAAFGPLPNWTGWNPAYQADMNDTDLYPPVPPATPATQTVRLYATFSPYTPGTEVEVPFDNFSNPPVTGNAIREWGYDSGDNTVYLSGGQNSTGNPIRIRLEKT